MRILSIWRTMPPFGGGCDRGAALTRLHLGCLPSSELPAHDVGGSIPASPRRRSAAARLLGRSVWVITPF